MRNRKFIRFGSVVMCAVMVAGCLAACGNVETESPIITDVEMSSASDNTSESTLTDALSKKIGLVSAGSGKTDTKEETIYVFTDASGAKNKVLVNEKLKNVSGQDTIDDVTTLKNIVNLTGDEEYTAGNGDSLTWDAQGSDITYRGTTDEEMPVDIKVTYYLDDKEISPEELAGKSGKVKIRFDYTNNEKRTINVNGDTKEAYVPFTVVTGMVLSDEHFYNIEVENGRVTETGSGNMVVGVAMPGLKESLDLSFNDKELDLDIPEYVEVTADVVDFEIDMMMSMATANIVSDVDLDDFNLDDLNESMTELKDATGELIDGTKELQDGTQELQDNMPDLDSGLTDLNNGAGDLLDGAIKIHEGAGTLGSGIYTLSDSVEKQLVPGIDALATGSKQVSDGVNQLASTISGMGTSIQSAKDGVIAQANAGLAANEALTAAAGTTVTMDNIDTVITAFKAKRSEAEGYLSYTDQQACVAAIMQAMQSNQELAATVAGIMQAYQCEQDTAINIIYTNLTDEQKAGYAAQFRTAAQQGVDSLDSAIETLAGVKSQVEGATAALDGVMAQLSSTDSTESLKKLTEGAAQVSDGMAQLKTSVGTFDQTEIDAVLESGKDTICSGLYKLKDGASQLGEGTQELWDGSKDLKDGTQELRDSGDDLIEGVKKLNDGAIELKDGVKEYDEDGIQKLTSLVDDDANDILDTLKQVIQLGKDYKSFAGKNESWDGSTVFIYRMNGINND